MTRTMITCEGVSKRFRIPHQPARTLKERIIHPIRSRSSWNDFQALRSVGFDVQAGEFFGIVGRNGSGKSTLLKTLAGIYKPDSGRVNINGTLASFIELGVGFNMDLSGRENLYINGALMGMTRRELKRRYDSIVDFAELHDFMDMRLRNYSSGMQVRLAFSVAVESGSEILLTDEVLAVGDERFQEKCFDVFRERRRRGTTIVFVSHDMAAIERFCDRAMVLERGEVRGIGEPPEMTDLYRELNLGPGSVERSGQQQPKSSPSDRPIALPRLTIDEEQQALGAVTAERRQQIRSFAGMAYESVLRRAARGSDLDWVVKSLALAEKAPTEIIDALTSSDEYRWIRGVDGAIQLGLRARLLSHPLSDLVCQHGAEHLLEIPWVLSRIPLKGRVMDIGAAKAIRLYHEALGSLDGCSVDTLDSNEHEIKNATPIVAAYQRIPVAEATYDAVLLRGSLHRIIREEHSDGRMASADHVDIERILTEAARILRPGGRLLATVPTGQREDRGLFIQEPPEVWRELFSRSGLKVTSSETYELHTEGWRLAESFSATGVQYGTHGDVASAVLCLEATPAAT